MKKVFSNLKGKQIVFIRQLRRVEVTPKKKIIGLSCGRVNGNSEILLKEALMGAEEIGVQSEIIRAMEPRAKSCTGCAACAMAMARGKESRCAIKADDVEWMLETGLG